MISGTLRHEGAVVAEDPEPLTRVLAGYRRTAGDRGRGQARPFGAGDLAAVLAICHRPRRRGRGVESDLVALERGRLDAVTQDCCLWRGCGAAR